MGGRGGAAALLADPLEPWRAYAPQIRGHAIAGAGHFLMEEAPADVAADLEAFLSVEAPVLAQAAR